MEKEDLAALIEGEPEGVAEEEAQVTEQPPPAAERQEAGETPTLHVSPPPPEPGHVPVAALLDERDKRKALEKRLADLEAERKTEGHAPEPTTAQQMWALRMDVSRELMVSQHGEAEAQALHEWGEAKCGSDPHFNAQVYASKNPYAFIRQARQREMLLAEVSPDDLDDYKAWKASKAQGGSPAPTPQATPSPTPTPPRSLANAPNAGGAGAVAETPMGPGAAFASTIRR
jgi:hypothetical protein